MEKVSFKIGSNKSISDVPYKEGSLIFLRNGSNKGSIYVDMDGYRTQYTNESYDDTDVRNLIATIDAKLAGLPRLFLTVSSLPSVIGSSSNVEYAYESQQLSFQGYGTLTSKENRSLENPKRIYLMTLNAPQDFGWGSVSECLLRANYTDHTHLRNLINTQLWAEMVQSRADYYELPEKLVQSPNKGVITGYPIKMYVNGVYQGLYTLNMAQSELTYGMTSDKVSDGTEFVLKALQNTNLNPTATPSNMRQTTTAANIVKEQSYKVVVGDATSSFISTHYLTPLNNLINFILTTTDEQTFKSGIDNYLDIWSAIDYYIFSYATCGLNMLGKYQLFMCYDGQHFIYSLDDTDATWGLYWDGKNIVPVDYKCPEDYEETYNLLFQRIEQWYPDELYNRWNYLKTHELNYKNVITKMENFWYGIGDRIYEEDYTATPYKNIPSKEITDINQLRNFVYQRYAYVDGEFDYFSPADYCRGLSLTIPSSIVGVGNSITISARTLPLRTLEPLVWSVSESPSGCVSWTINDREITINGIDDGTVDITATCGNYTESTRIRSSSLNLEEHVLAQDFVPDGTSFSYTAPISLSLGQFIEVSINPSTIAAEKENILSIGQDLENWKGNYPHIHMYISASTKLTTMNVDVNSSSGYIRKAVPLSFDDPNNPEIIVKLSENGLEINDTTIVAAGAWSSIMSDITSLTSYGIASVEGINRSHAVYNYIRYFSLAS